MKRTVRIKLSYEVVIDDDHEGLPFIRSPNDLVFNGARMLQGLVEIKAGAKLDMALDRESASELRRRDRVRRVNAR